MLKKNKKYFFFAFLFYFIFFSFSNSISDEGIKSRDQIVINNFFQKRIPLCGVLGGGYNKDLNKLIELHSILHKSCAEIL